MPAPRRNLQKLSQTRVFTFDGGAGPGVVPVYQGLARAHNVQWQQGTLTPTRIPSDRRYGDFITVDRIRGQKPLPTLPIEFRMTRDLSDVLRLVRKGCVVDLQVHVGACTDPTDFFAFEKIMVLQGALSTDYQTTELGAFDGNQDAPAGETVTFEGLDYFEIAPIRPEEVAAAAIVQEAVAVSICDQITCAECGLPSDGCQTVFVLSKSHGGSPGLPAQLLFTTDGFATSDSTVVSSLPANMNPIGMACVGTNLVVISNEDNSIHYAPIADILSGTETWTKVTTGLVAAKAPNAIVSLGRAFTWIVGDGGYIYFSDDITAGVVVQTDGSVTVQSLKGIAAWDNLHLVAVGAANAVLTTENGGANSWAAITGPNIGVTLNCVAMKTQGEWIVGDDGGQLWYTRDTGVSWTEKRFPGSGSGKVKAIAFSNDTVGYLSHTTAAPRGYVLRTVDGGQSFYRLPETPGLSFNDNDGLNALAVCEEDMNLVYAVGLGANGTDGIALKVA